LVQPAGTAQLLGLWERCLSRTPAERALEILTLTSSGDALEDLTVGERDRRLLDLREHLFGSELTGATTCRNCDDSFDFVLDVDQLRDKARADTAGEFTVSRTGFDVRCRLPTTADLAKISRERDPIAGRQALVERCVLTVRQNGVASTIDALRPEVIEALAQRMAQAEPIADVELALSCPSCGHTWEEVLDIASFMWTELDAWTRRTLQDVHTLASTYGWSEADILALGPRRQVYLDLARA
jgi:hypothetical protein